MRTSIARAAAPAVLLLLAVVRIAASDRFAAGEEQTFAEPESAGPSAEARATLRDLAVGDRLAGLEVTRIAGPEGAEITVELRDPSGRGMRAWVGRRGVRGYDPSVRTERYDLFNGPPSPGAESVSDEASYAVLRALAARIDPPATTDPQL